MYSIDLDNENRLLRVELSGRIDKDAIISYSTELNNLIQQLKQNEFSIILSLERLDPLPQELLPIMITCLEGLGERLYSIAAVFKKVVTRMQFQRIIAFSSLRHDIKDRIRIFNSTQDALHYLQNERKRS